MHWESEIVQWLERLAQDRNIPGSIPGRTPTMTMSSSGLGVLLKAMTKLRLELEKKFADLTRWMGPSICLAIYMCLFYYHFHWTIFGYFRDQRLKDCGQQSIKVGLVQKQKSVQFTWRLSCDYFHLIG